MKFHILILLAAQCIASGEPTAIYLSNVEYHRGTTHGRESSQATAVAIAREDVKNKDSIVWLVHLPGFSNGNATIINFPQIWQEPAMAESRGDISGGIRGTLHRRIRGTDFYLAHTNFMLEESVFPGQSNEIPVGSVRPVFTKVGNEGEHLVEIGPAIRMEAGQETIAFSEEAMPGAHQHLVPFLNDAGAFAAIATPGTDGEWQVSPIPDLEALKEPTVGPFEVSGTFGERDNALQINLAGPFVPASDAGQYHIAIGLESDVLHAFDREGRRTIFQPGGGSRGQMQQTKLRRDVVLDGISHTFHLRIDPPRDEITLMGQLFREIAPKEYEPLPPFTLQVNLGEMSGIRVVEGDVFVSERDRSGKSHSPFLDDAEIIELPDKLALNSTWAGPWGIALIPEDGGKVRIYQPATRELTELPTTLTGGSLLAAGDKSHLYLLDRNTGMIEKWDPLAREMHAAGKIPNPDEVLAIASVSARPEPLLVLLCKERYRFLHASDLQVASPALVGGYRSTSVMDSYDFTPPLERLRFLVDATSAPSYASGTAAFRVLWDSHNEQNPSEALVLREDSVPGRIAVQRTTQVAAANAHGDFVFKMSRTQQISENDLRLISAVDSMRSVGKGLPGRGRAICGFFPAIDGSTLALAATNVPAWLPRRSPEISIFSRHLTGEEHVDLGAFGELADCLAEFQPGQPWVQRHAFFLPEHDAIITLDDAREKIYHRTLRTQAVRDSLASGAFMVMGGGRINLQRGQTLRLPINVAGSANPTFTLVSGPDDATLTPQGVFVWTCSEFFTEEMVTARMRIEDPATGRFLEVPLEMRISGQPQATIRSADGEEEPRLALPRIHGVPGNAGIFAMRDVDFGRRQVLITRGWSDGKYRLEIFDAAEETWLAGAILPELPDLMLANPETIYLIYRKRGIIEVRPLAAPDQLREVKLIHPLAAIGCGRDTTGGALCLIEAFDPKQDHADGFIDWDGEKKFVAPNQRARVVLLSPSTLKPLRNILTPADERQVIADARYNTDERIREVVFSPDGLKAAYGRFVMFLDDAEKQVRLAEGPDVAPRFVTDDGGWIYGSSRTFLGMNPGPVFLPVVAPTAFENGSPVFVRPLANSPIDLAIITYQQGRNTETFAHFLIRNDGKPGRRIGPLAEVENPYTMQMPRPQIELASMHQGKLITIGHGWRSLWVRDIGED